MSLYQKSLKNTAVSIRSEVPQHEFEFCLQNILDVGLLGRLLKMSVEWEL
jgi:hypothetical protein